MNGTTLQGLIYAGYAQAAAKVGLPYDVFRAGSALNPLAPGNKVVAALPCYLGNKGALERPVKYGDFLWWSCHDATQTLPGDYLVGHMGTFFIAAQQDLLAVLAVHCNRVLSVFKPVQNAVNGPTSYGGQIDADDVVILQDWPGCVREGSRGDKNDVDLPLDAKNPWWSCLLPAFAGVEIDLSMRVMDDLGRKYWVQSAELSDLGWRLRLQQVQA